MKYRIHFTRLFRRQLKRAIKQGWQHKEIIEIIDNLAMEMMPSPYLKPHRLKGNFSGAWELHIAPDLLLIYRYHENRGILELSGIGTHSELFG